MSEKINFRPDPCIHSMTVGDCASCWHGVAQRIEYESHRLRELIEMYGDDDLKKHVANHDKYWLGGNAPSSSQERWDV